MSNNISKDAVIKLLHIWLMIGKRGVDGVVGVSKQEDAAKLFRDKETYTPCYQFVLKFVFVVGIGCRK